MSAALALTGAGLVSWVLRVLFIVLVPARRLPPPVQRALSHTGPAALAALLVTDLARSGSDGRSPVALPLALIAAALVARRTRSLLLATGAGIGAFALLTLRTPPETRPPARERRPQREVLMIDIDNLGAVLGVWAHPDDETFLMCWPLRRFQRWKVDLRPQAHA